MGKTEAQLKELLERLNNLESIDKHRFHRVAERVKAIAFKEFGSNQIYNKEVQKIYERITLHTIGLNSEHIDDLKRVISVMIGEAQLYEAKTLKAKKNSDLSEVFKQQHLANSNNKVLIVNGHNNLILQETVKMLTKLHLESIILHQQGDTDGAGIIEKFNRNSDIHFVVVLLSADDFGYAKNESDTNKKLRARQNEIFELGFCYSKLGQERVVALFEDVENFEKPYYTDGVTYIPYDLGDNKWKFDLVNKLKLAGYNVDANVFRVTSSSLN